MLMILIITIVICFTTFFTIALILGNMTANKKREENIIVILENIMERLEQLEKR